MDSIGNIQNSAIVRIFKRATHLLFLVLHLMAMVVANLVGNKHQYYPNVFTGLNRAHWHIAKNIVSSKDTCLYLK